MKKRCIVARSKNELWDIITYIEIENKNYKYNDIVHHKMLGNLKVVRHEANTVICVKS